MLHTYRMLLMRVAVASGVGVNASEENDLYMETSALKSRLKAAEEQAAAAWDKVGKLEKVVEELRQGAAAEFATLGGRVGELEGHPGLL